MLEKKEKNIQEFGCNSNLGHEKRIFLRTFGCQMNERDSEMIKQMFIEAGFVLTENMENADFVFLNTCSVRQNAENRVIGNIQRVSVLKNKKPMLKIGIIGCMAARYKEQFFKDYPCVDIIIGPNNIFDIPDILLKDDYSEKILRVDKEKRLNNKKSFIYSSGNFSSFVNIMHGCNNYCSYCIVPYVRGREISRPKKDIINEIKMLVDKGIKEFVLLGQNVNSYGKGLSSKITFSELLENINNIKGVERIRFVSNHPKDASKELFRAIKDLDKVCKNLHLALQSGSNKILDLMNRQYTYEEYKEKVELLRSMVPDLVLTTDIIVGFPSEKEKDFMQTFNAIKEIGFNSSFIFKYSPREPALSVNFVDDVSIEDKKERNNKLLLLQEEISFNKNKALIGTEKKVLVESISRMSNKELIGKTFNNISCVFEGEQNLIGKIVDVKIKDSSVHTLKGELISK